ncbi:unnamed protein product [Caenorhabditis auriculariae]|uniref:Uncharacterized protein n=1 Tax=Caenorhabditis auriculariae TaxID=2777116 RepID=A0A8S1HV87_9PELO|nr:unnamed protein product [Caenorhabditis auriculariae]
MIQLPIPLATSRTHERTVFNAAAKIFDVKDLKQADPTSSSPRTSGEDRSEFFCSPKRANVKKEMPSTGEPRSYLGTHIKQDQGASSRPQRPRNQAGPPLGQVPAERLVQVIRPPKDVAIHDL